MSTTAQRWGTQPGDQYGLASPEWRAVGAHEEARLKQAQRYGWAGLIGKYAGSVFALRERARELREECG